MKKFIRLVLVLFLLVNLSACSSGKLGSDAFEKWIELLPKVLLGSEDYTLYAFFEDPSNANIEAQVEGLTFISEEEYKASIKDYKELKKELKQFNYKELNEDLKITYDLIDYYLTNCIKEEDYYYLSVNYFDINNGVQASLAMNLYFMDLVSEDCIDAIINVMESTTEMLPIYVEYEEKRQKEGFGLSKTYMDDVIEQVHIFNSADQSYILEGISNKIREVSFLEENEKNEKIKQLEKVFNTNFIPAFKQLEIDLKEVEILCEDKDASLANYKNGKKYYEQILYDATGFTSVDAFDAYLSSKEKELINRLLELVGSYPELYNAVQTGSMDAEYTDLNSVSELLSFFEKKVNEEGDFPTISSFTYQMDVVPVEMQEIINASAAYFIGPIDNKDAHEQMILNGSFAQSDYNTIAHEGFPGHMYQYRYFKSTEHSMIRDILTNIGYTEAWAVYSSKEMNKYAKDAALCEFMSINEDLTYLYLLRMDYMIHYDGEDRESIYEYLTTNFGIEEEEALSEVYEQTLEDPGIFLPYYGYYYRLLDLKEDAKEEWDSEYSDYRFHKAILDIGSVPYHLLEEYMYEQF